MGMIQNRNVGKRLALSNPKLYIKNQFQTSKILRYFFYRNYRVKEWNKAYQDIGWIYCTNELTKLRAEMIVFWREYNPGRILKVIYHMVTIYLLNLNYKLNCFKISTLRKFNKIN